MPVSPARVAAFDILLRVGQQDAFASELLHSDRFASLSHPDHALTTELVMGVLRWQSLLDHRISQISSHSLARLDQEVLISLRLATYQLLFLSRIPARAAIHESVELVKRARKRSAVPFANAVLRKLATQTSGSHLDRAGPGNHDRGGYHAALSVMLASQDSLTLAVNSAHPLWLVERWTQDFGPETAKLICAHNQSIPITSIRLRDPSIEDQLRQEGIGLDAGTLLSTARRLGTGDISKTRAFTEGRVAIQDEASQLVAFLAGHGSRLLDCCAAPGGKTAILADRNPDSLIIATELHPHRAQLLRKLAGARNTHVLAADARALPLTPVFDRVLVDVPCSGTGTLARNPEIKWRLQPEDLPDLQSRQLAILHSAMSHVAPCGRLVYSTCSLEPEENSDVVEKALAADASFRLLDCRAELENLTREGILTATNYQTLLDGKYLRTIPGVLPVDGFFAAILEKTSS